MIILLWICFLQIESFSTAPLSQMHTEIFINNSAIEPRVVLATGRLQGWASVVLTVKAKYWDDSGKWEGLVVQGRAG